MTAARAIPNIDPRRRAMLGKVHIARKELGLDEATYRAKLAQLTGQASAGDCTDAQLQTVLDDFKARGWTPSSARAPAKPPGRRLADSPIAKKARALWISLHQLGVIDDPADTALEAFARRQLKVDALQWADQALAYRLIEALKAMAERAGWPQTLSPDEGRNAGVVLKRRLAAAMQARLGLPASKMADTALDVAISMLANQIRVSPR